mmetsp:Transcript_18122/g.38009  ORF Transcript_18122/g.38009 Transcript_18122/m.38009 type:complete len:251 (-) Transcript_18122:1647-2399(-)
MRISSLGRNKPPSAWMMNWDDSGRSWNFGNIRSKLTALIATTNQQPARSSHQNRMFRAARNVLNCDIVRHFGNESILIVPDRPVGKRQIRGRRRRLIFRWNFDRNGHGQFFGILSSAATRLVLSPNESRSVSRHDRGVMASRRKLHQRQAYQRRQFLRRSPAGSIPVSRNGGSSAGEEAHARGQDECESIATRDGRGTTSFSEQHPGGATVRRSLEGGQRLFRIAARSTAAMAELSHFVTSPCQDRSIGG